MSFAEPLVKLGTISGGAEASIYVARALDYVAIVNWRYLGMWKNLVLCASLFGGAALGLASVARWMEAAALPATAAIGLCLIGVVLILSAPPLDPVERYDESLSTPLKPPTPQPIRASLTQSGNYQALDVPPMTPRPENKSGSFRTA